MSHSKRNTSLAFFTAHERAELRSAWGKQRTRITRDSILRLGSCALCLQPAREPVACADGGHVFCRECAVANLLTQRSEIRRVGHELQRRRREDEKREREKDEEERVKLVKDFERVATGMGARMAGEARRHAESGGDEGKGRGLKRKFVLDEEEMRRNSKADRARARRELDDEKASRPTLPSFWVPSLTPNYDAASDQAKKLTPVCPAASGSNKPHPLSLKTLVAVNFSTPNSLAGSKPRKPAPTSTGDEGSSIICCPSCTKTLSAKAMLAIPCGHVICRPCVHKFMGLPPDPHASQASEIQGEVHGESLLCLVCQTDLSRAHQVESKSKEERGKVAPGLVQLSTDPSGFAASGSNIVTKHGISFQC